MKRRGFLAHGKAYPSRAVTLLVPFGAGSGTDVMGRIVGQQFGPPLGQNVIIENKAGATSMLAANAVARSAPDMQRHLAELGVEAQSTSPAEFGRFLQAEVAKWASWSTTPASSRLRVVSLTTKPL